MARKQYFHTDTNNRVHTFFVDGNDTSLFIKITPKVTNAATITFLQCGNPAYSFDLPSETAANDWIVYNQLVGEITQPDCHCP